jgi:predicted metal-dependent hydrolase
MCQRLEQKSSRKEHLMPTPHNFRSSSAIPMGHEGAMTTRGAVKAIGQLSNELRKNARAELQAVAQERRREAHEYIENMQHEVTELQQAADAMVSELHDLRGKCTQEVRANLHELRSGLQAAVSEQMEQFAATRRRETGELRKNLAEFRSALSSDVATFRQSLRDALGFDGEIRRPARPARSSRPLKAHQKPRAARPAQEPSASKAAGPFKDWRAEENASGKAAKRAAKARGESKKSESARGDEQNEM